MLWLVCTIPGTQRFRLARGGHLEYIEAGETEDEPGVGGIQNGKKEKDKVLRIRTGPTHLQAIYGRSQQLLFGETLNTA